MFDRKVIKEQAKTLIKRSYWMLVLVVFLTTLLGGTIGDAGVNSVNLDTVFDNSDIDPDIDLDDQSNAGVWVPDTQPDNPWEEYATPETPFDLTELWREFAGSMGMALPVLIGAFAVVILLACATAIAFAIFVSNIVTVGANGWMMRYWRGETPAVGDLFAGFRMYRPVLGAMFLRELLTFLWSLLFVVPGIIKGLAYSMVPYIIYENPHLTASQALKISEKMTDGAKGDLFVLKLSFIGWNILSAITGGIVGYFYVYPYMGVTYAGVYDQLKWNAIQTGRLSWSDFGQTVPQPEWSAPAAPVDFYGQ